MENASKALIIAGGVLIFVALMSVMTYVFRTMSSGTSSLYGELEDSDITQFNQQFLNYDAKDNLTIQDVVSIINIARNNNDSRKNACRSCCYNSVEGATNRNCNYSN